MTAFTAPLWPSCRLQATALASAAITTDHTQSLTDEAAEKRPVILHFIHGIGGGGAESMLRALVSRLDRRRWRVVVVAMRAANRPAEARELDQSCDAFYALEEDAFISRAALTKLRAVLRRERPAVVQTWMHHADLVGGVMARLAGVRRVLWSIHCREITRAPGESAWKASLLRRLLPIASKVVPSRIISCSQAAVEDHVRFLGYPTGKMQWIANGVDTQRFAISPQARQQTRERLGLSDNDLTLGFVGRFHEMKNLPLLLQAFQLLVTRLPQARLLMCGVRQEDLDAECSSLVKALPAAENVLLQPFQNDPERFYPALDLFTLSSRTEACPMTILEAMSCGVPCVTTDVGDCALLIGDTGATTPSGNAAALAEAWERWLSLPSGKRTSIGAAARARVQEHFSLEQTAAAYQRLYETLTPTAA